MPLNSSSAGRMNQAGAAAGTSDTPSPTTNPLSRPAPRRMTAAPGYGGAPRPGGYGPPKPALPPATAPVNPAAPRPTRPATAAPGGNLTPWEQAAAAQNQPQRPNPFSGSAPVGLDPKRSPYPQDQGGFNGPVFTQGMSQREQEQRRRYRESQGLPPPQSKQDQMQYMIGVQRPDGSFGGPPPGWRPGQPLQGGGPTPKTSPYPMDQVPGRGRPVQGQAGPGYDGPRPNDTRTPGELMDAYNRMQQQGQLDFGMYDQFRGSLAPKQDDLELRYY